MKLTFKTLFFFILVFTCSSVFSQKNSPVKEIPDGNALVYFIRPSAIGFAVPYSIYCDTVHLGTIRAKHYYYYYIPEGEYKFISKMSRPKGKEIDLVLKDREIYYINIDGGAKLSLVKNQKEANKYLKKSKNANEKFLLEGGIIKYK